MFESKHSEVMIFTPAALGIIIKHLYFRFVVLWTNIPFVIAVLHGTNRFFFCLTIYIFSCGTSKWPGDYKLYCSREIAPMWISNQLIYKECQVMLLMWEHSSFNVEINKILQYKLSSFLMIVCHYVMKLIELYKFCFTTFCQDYILIFPCGCDTEQGNKTDFTVARVKQCQTYLQ